MQRWLPNDWPKALAATTVGALVLLVGLGALRAQSEARELDARERARLELDRAADDIAAAIAAARSKLADVAADEPLYRAVLARQSELLATSPHALWWSDGNSVAFLTEKRFAIPDSLIVGFLGEAQRPPLRIVTTNDGADVILLEQRVPAARGWIGAGIGVAELIAHSALQGIVSSGFDVALFSETGAPVYWATPAALDRPIVSAVRLGEQRWELHASPRTAWRDTAADWQTALLVSLLACGSGLAVWSLAARPQALREQIVQLTADLAAKDSDLSRLLRNRSQIENQLATSLTVDLYTGLPNRASFVEHLQARLARTRLAADAGVLVAVVLLHRLSELGHSMGTAVAEEVMREAGERLQRAAGPDAYLARTGESELALAFSLAALQDRAQLAERLLHGLETRFAVGRRAIYVPAVVGVALSRDGYSHGPELLGQAALATNTAVAEGLRSAEFRPEAREQRISLLQLEADLQAAIDGHDLRLFFQPIVSVTNGHVVGFESLVRWHHATESWIGPDRFIPLAESMGQMARISDWVLEQGVAHTKQFAQLRAEPLYVTLNLTPRDLNRELSARLFRLLDRAALPPQCVRIEITETAVVRDFRFAARLIAELNERGVRVLLDDFGTGYSSLSYLRDLPFHAVKIDKSFIHRMSTEARDFGLVKSIVGLVHYLGMECIAEGIETQEQLDLIAMMDCNYWQGFLFSPPLPAEGVEPLLRDARHRRHGTAVASAS